MEKVRKAATLTLLLLLVFISGCGEGYTNESLYPDNISSVCIEMFDNTTFRQGVEYTLTDAVSKRLESETPYKVISDKDKADTLLTGKLVMAGERSLVVERETGRALEKGVEMLAVVSWKDLRSGKILLDNVEVEALSSYSEWQSQGYEYGASQAANKLAVRIVELLENEW